MMEESTEGYRSPEAAFAAGLTGHALFGAPLAKFSTSRKIAAQAMGCMAPASFTAEAYAAFRQTLQYPGLQNDVINILWLCTLADTITTAVDYRAGVFTPDRAIALPGEALTVARRWAEKVKLDNMASDEFQAAWKVFLQIVFAVDASLFEVGTDGGGAPGGGGPPPKAMPGHPTSRSSSHGSPGKAAKRSRRSGKSSRT